MSVTVITSGTPGLASWGAAVANQLNRSQFLVTTTDVSKAASSWSDITGLSASVVNGKNYAVRAFLAWDQSSTSGGIRIGANFPTGNYRAFHRFSGETSESAFVTEWHTTSDDGSGVATADSTNARGCIIEGRYICQADGTFTLRYYRNTTGTAKIQAGAWLELVADS